MQSALDLVEEFWRRPARPVGFLPKLAAATLLSSLGYDGWLAMTGRTALVGASLGAFLLGAMAVAWKFVRGEEGLGWGDVWALRGPALGARSDDRELSTSLQ